MKSTYLMLIGILFLLSCESNYLEPLPQSSIPEGQINLTVVIQEDNFTDVENPVGALEIKLITGYGTENHQVCRQAYTNDQGKVFFANLPPDEYWYSFVHNDSLYTFKDNLLYKASINREISLLDIKTVDDFTLQSGKTYHYQFQKTIFTALHDPCVFSDLNLQVDILEEVSPNSFVVEERLIGNILQIFDEQSPNINTQVFESVKNTWTIQDDKLVITGFDYDFTWSSLFFTIDAPDLDSLISINLTEDINGIESDFCHGYIPFASSFNKDKKLKDHIFSENQYDYLNIGTNNSTIIFYDFMNMIVRTSDYNFQFPGPGTRMRAWQRIE